MLLVLLPKHDFMKNLLFIFFFIIVFAFLVNPLFSNCQTIHMNCYQENTCEYTTGAALKTLKKTVKFCYNNDVFSFSDGRQIISFPITHYNQDIRNKHMVESFNSPDRDRYLGEYMVEIEHSKPAYVTISKITEPSWAYVITTNKIPGIFVKFSPEYLKADSTQKAQRKIYAAEEKIRREKEDSLARYVDSMNHPTRFNDGLRYVLNDSLDWQQIKGNISENERKKIFTKLYNERAHHNINEINYPDDSIFLSNNKSAVITRNYQNNDDILRRVRLEVIDSLREAYKNNHLPYDDGTLMKDAYPIYNRKIKAGQY